MIRVLVTDAEPLVRCGLRALLGAAGDIDVVGEAADGAAALARARELAPDLVVTDLRMPGLNGNAVIRRLRALPSPPAVLVLTDLDSTEGVAEALCAGAGGYLLKDAPAEQVIGAVRLVAAGCTVLASRFADRLVEASRSMNGPDAGIPLQQRRKLEALGERQREILAHLAQGRSNAQIACRMYLTESTVKRYVSRLLITLGVDNRTQAAILAHRTGLTGKGAR